MRHFALLGVLALLALAGSAGVLVVTGTASARSDAANDGALSVKNADGKVVLVASKGVVIGRLGNGWLTIKDPSPNHGNEPIVTGADRTTTLNENTKRYSGAAIRFRIIGGAFSLTVGGTDIDLSMVGKGLVTLDGTLSANVTDDPTYAVNGGQAQPFPMCKFTFPLTGTQVIPGGC